MKQHDKIYDDEALYRQMLDELRPAAEEYDRMVAQGLQPARQARRGWGVVARYAAAACVLVAITGGILTLLQHGENAPTPPVVAEVQLHPAHSEHTHHVQVQDPSHVAENSHAMPLAEMPAQPEQPLHKAKVATTTATTAQAPEPTATVAEAPTGSVTETLTVTPEPTEDAAPHTQMAMHTQPDTDAEAEALLMPVLLAEIENRAVALQLMEEHMHRALIEEIFTNMIEQPEGPQLTL